MRTLGHVFRETRESKGMTTSQSAEGTRIKPKTLDWMEDDCWDKMPAPLYARGFIKIYAEFLDLKPEPLIDAYTRWTRSDHKRPPCLDDDGGLPVAVPVPRPEISVSRLAEVKPPVAPPPVKVAAVSPPEEVRPVLAPVPPPAPIAPSPTPIPPPPRSAPVSRPSSASSAGFDFSGMGGLFKYIPIGLGLILVLVLLFSGLKRWGRIPGTATASMSTSISSQSPSTAIGDSSAAPAGGGSTGLVLAEDPPATYFDDAP